MGMKQKSNLKRLGLAVSLCVVAGLFSCRTAAPSDPTDIADPGALGGVNRYFKLVRSQVQMAECAADQVPTARCEVGPVLAPYELFARLAREELAGVTAAAKAAVNAAELPLRNAQSAAAKAESDSAEAALNTLIAKTAGFNQQIEAGRVRDKGLGVQQTDIEATIATIEARLKSAAAADKARLQALLEANRADLTTVQGSRTAVQAEMATITTERDNHVRLFEAPAREFFALKNAAYKAAFDAAVTPTPELTALRGVQTDAESAQAKLEELLTMLIDKDVPYRANMQDSLAQKIVKELFVKSIKAANAQSMFGIFKGQQICSKLLTVKELNSFSVTFEVKEESGRQVVVDVPAFSEKTIGLSGWEAVTKHSLTLTWAQQGVKVESTYFRADEYRTRTISAYSRSDCEQAGGYWSYDANTCTKHELAREGYTNRNVCFE
jgi:hypothetical protein